MSECCMYDTDEDRTRQLAETNNAFHMTAVIADDSGVLNCRGDGGRPVVKQVVLTLDDEDDATMTMQGM